MTSSTSIDINLARKEMVILGTQYAGEMKKGLFSLMHYLMPKRHILSLHSGCNVGKKGDVALFFGLSGIVYIYPALWDQESYIVLSDGIYIYVVLFRYWEDNSVYGSQQVLDRR